MIGKIIDLSMTIEEGLSGTISEVKVIQEMTRQELSFAVTIVRPSDTLPWRLSTLTNLLLEYMKHSALGVVKTGSENMSPILKTKVPYFGFTNLS